MRELVLVDEMYGRLFELPPGDVVLGRSDACDVTIPRGSVARRHAVITNDGEALTLCDNATTNGTYFQPRGTGNACRLGARRQPLAAGDAIHIGPARFVIRPAEWVGDEPPGGFPAAVSARSHEVLTAIRAGAPKSSFSADELDSAWVAAYTRWRALPASGSIFELAATLCSPGMLIAIRDALDDPVRWFVDFGLDGVEMLLETEHSIGFVLALDVRLRHSGRGFREAAGRAIRAHAQRRGRSISQLATDRYLDASSELGNLAEDGLFERLAEDVIESSRKEGRAWPQETWNRLLGSPAFAASAANFVFVARESGQLFRPENGELLGLDEVVAPRARDTIGVALELDAEWSEHLAEHEIVQPFAQQI